jgi:hypothetical protein
MNDEKLVPQRCDPADPRRCQKSAMNGQCPFLSIPGHDYCPIHGPVPDQNAAGLYAFNKTEVLVRISKFRGHGDSRTLAVELGLLRLLLEQLINKCEGPYDLLTCSGQISNLITQIKELQVANIKLEQKVGDLMTAEQVIEIAQGLYNVVSSILSTLPNGTDLLAEIAEQFDVVLGGANS